MQRLLYTAYLLMAIAVLAPLGFVRAEDGQPPLTPIQKMRDQKQDIKEMRKDVIKGIKDVRIDAQGEIKDLKIDTVMQLKSATTGPEKKGIIRDAWGERKDVKQGVRDAVAPMKRQLKALAHAHLGLAAERFRAALAHLHNIADRIASRIEKLKTAGVDTATAEAELSEAEAAIADAEADVQAVADYVASISDVSEPKTVRDTIPGLVRAANQGVKAAHKALMEAARALSNAAKQFRTSTTTPAQ